MLHQQVRIGLDTNWNLEYHAALYSRPPARDSNLRLPDGAFADFGSKKGKPKANNASFYGAQWKTLKILKSTYPLFIS